MGNSKRNRKTKTENPQRPVLPQKKADTESVPLKMTALLSKDLDRIIEQDRTIMWEMGTLETGGRFDDITMGQILEEITREARGLKEPAGAPPIQQAVKPHMAEPALLNRLHRIDDRLKKLPLYQKVLRPQVAERLKARLMTRHVDASELMGYDGAAFVSACYQTFLGRQPEPEAMHNTRSLLVDGRMRKIYFLMQVANSEEASQHLIVLRGTKKYLRRERLRSMALHLPLAERLARLSATLGALGYQQELLEAKYQESSRGLQSAGRRLDELAGTVDVHERSLDGLEKQNDGIHDSLAALEKRQEETAKKNEQLLSQHETSLSLLGDDVNSLNTWQAEVQAEGEQRRQRLERFKRRLDSFYIHYEHSLLPISEETYYSRHAHYFKKVDAWAGDRDKAALTIVDLGCGDGMWLKALEKRGYKPTGVDSNEQMLASARNNVIEGKLYLQDAVSFLQEQGEGTLDMISSFHMIEHMEPIELFEFFEACERTLKPGGLFILETPNPKNILVATEQFYMDVTHKHIIPWELLEFLMKDFGFEQIETVPITPLDYFPIEYKQNDPVSHMAFRFNNETAYSVWAVKPA